MKPPLQLWALTFFASIGVHAVAFTALGLLSGVGTERPPHADLPAGAAFGLHISPPLVQKASNDFRKASAEAPRDLVDTIGVPEPPVEPQAADPLAPPAPAPELPLSMSESFDSPTEAEQDCRTPVLNEELLLRIDDLRHQVDECLDSVRQQCTEASQLFLRRAAVAVRRLPAIKVGVMDQTVQGNVPPSVAATPSMPESDLSTIEQAQAALEGEEPLPGTTPGVASGPRPDARNTPPEYPQEARKRGQSGIVRLHLCIEIDGRVTGVEVIESSGFAILDRAAVKSAASWRFTPAMRNGRPIRAEADLPVAFVLK